MIFFGGHNNLIMVCEPLLPFRVKSYVSDWSRRDNLLESNNSILISDMLSTWNRKENIIMRVVIMQFISTYSWTCWDLLYHFCRLWPLLSKHSEKERNWDMERSSDLCWSPPRYQNFKWRFAKISASLISDIS